jgi:hypothetical protein
MLGIRHQFVTVPVVVPHHAIRNPRYYLLVAVLMHPNQRPRVHEGLDDGCQRPVAVVIVARKRSTGEIEMGSERSLIL